MKTIKLEDFSNYDLASTIEEGVDTLNSKFRLFSVENLKEDSRWIVAYEGELSVDTIIGFMELVRYPIVGNATMSDKEPIPFDCFEESDSLSYVFEDELYELSQQDTFIVISNVEVLSGYRCMGIGKSIYEYLEDMITTEDCLIELTRTIDGRSHNLLGTIEKVPVFTNIGDLYDSL